MSVKRPSPPSPQPFAVAGRKVQPGTRARIEIPVAPLYNQSMVSLVGVVVHGTRPGPSLWVCGAIHGDELVGVAIIRELLHGIEPEGLAGTLVAFPAVNVFGVLQQSRYLPDRRDLNRSFPGSSKGSLAARLARTFMKEIVARCTHGIDLHTAATDRDNLPQIRANLEDRETLRLARAFGAPVVIHSNERDGSLRQAATKRGLPTLLYEAGPPLRHDAAAVRTGVEGVRRVMAALGMRGGSGDGSQRAGGVPPDQGATGETRALVSYETTWVRAPRSGYLVLETDLGRSVEKEALLGMLYVRLHESFFKEDHVEIRAPVAGVVIGVDRNPLVNVGEAVIHIAVVAQPKRRRG
jgi:predicted deacylase